VREPRGAHAVAEPEERRQREEERVEWPVRRGAGPAGQADQARNEPDRRKEPCEVPYGTPNPPTRPACDEMGEWKRPLHGDQQPKGGGARRATGGVSALSAANFDSKAIACTARRRVRAKPVAKLD